MQTHLALIATNINVELNIFFFYGTSNYQEKVLGKIYQSFIVIYKVFNREVD
jgi:hypothetical protein